MSFLDPLLSRQPRPCRLSNTRTGDVLAGSILCAFDSSTRRRGLLDREALDDGEAMVIAPSNAVHTFGMRFPIDLAFVTKAGRVVKVKPDVRPRRIALSWLAWAVVEMPVGTLDRTGTRAGDHLTVEASGIGGPSGGDKNNLARGEAR